MDGSCSNDTTLGATSADRGDPWSSVDRGDPWSSVDRGDPWMFLPGRGGGAGGNARRDGISTRLGTLSAA
jgi:hypothetical protein